MGNASSGAVTRVVSSDGRLQREYSSRRRHGHATSAAELMLDSPGHFVCDSSQLAVGCRIPGLASDAELKPGRLYLLLPVDLLYSVLTDEEMAVFARSAKGSVQPRCYFSRKIFPVLSEFCLVPTASGDEKVDIVEPATRDGRVDDRIEVSKQRSWRPALDTIREVDGSPKIKMRKAYIGLQKLGYCK